MPRSTIPKEATELAVYMNKIAIGDDKHKSERALAPEVRVPLDESRKRVIAADRGVQVAEAALAQRRQALREEKEKATKDAARARDSVYGLWGKHSMVLVDYGLKPCGSGRPKGRKKGEPE